MRRAVTSLAVAAAALLAGAGTAAETPRDALLLYEPGRATPSVVDLGTPPLRVSYADGAFWVVARDEGAILRVDAASRAIRRIPVGGEPYDVLVGDGVLWVPDHHESNLHRVDLSSGEVTDSEPFGAPALAVGYGFGAVWLQLAGQRLLRIDPPTLRATATIPNAARSREGLEPDIAVTRDAVWVSGASGGELLRVDPRRLRITRRLQRAGRGVAVAAGAIWSADGNRSLVRLRGRRATRIRVGALPVDVAASRSAVWVVTLLDRTLVQVDARRARVVRRIGLRGAYPAGVAAGADLVAVAVR